MFSIVFINFTINYIINTFIIKFQGYNINFTFKRTYYKFI